MQDNLSGKFKLYTGSTVSDRSVFPTNISIFHIRSGLKRASSASGYSLCTVESCGRLGSNTREQVLRRFWTGSPQRRSLRRSATAISSLPRSLVTALICG